jgi:hypothetical protein
MTITITISPGAVPYWDQAVSLTRTLAPLLLPVLLPILEEALPGLGAALALARLSQLSIATCNA